MVSFVRISNDNNFAGYHYIFEDIKDYTKYEPFLKYPRIDGNWKIAIVDFPIKHIRTFLDSPPPAYVEMTYFSRTDVLQKLQMEYPKLFTELQSKWDQYMGLIATLEKPIDRKASSELYKRTEGNLVEAKEALEHMILEYADEPTITYKQVASTILYQDKVYARDVVLHLLLKRNRLVPGKGSVLSRYKYNKWQYKLHDLIEEVGHDVAFYAIRKYINRLYENKMEYLYKGSIEVKDLEVLKIIDVYEILHAQIAFVDKLPAQLYSILKIIEGRTIDASIIARTFNTSRE